MEAELAPTVPELPDRLAGFYNRNRDLIQALYAPRSSFYRWRFKGHRPNPQTPQNLSTRSPPWLDRSRSARTETQIGAGPTLETRI
jgi:hypothetical protein